MVFHKGFSLIIVVVGIFVTISLIGAIAWLPLWKKPSPSNTFQASLPVASPASLSPSKTTQTNFFFLIGGLIERNTAGTYLVSNVDLTPFSPKQKLPLNPDNKTSALSIVVMDQSGKKDIHPLTANVCVDDYCISSKEELPINSKGAFGPLTIPFNPQAQEIQLLASNNIIWSLKRPSHSPKILGLTKKPAQQKYSDGRIEDGYAIAWDIDNPASTRVWIVIDSKTVSHDWEVVTFTDANSRKSINVDFANLFSPDRTVDFRITITDGFSIDQLTQEKFIMLPEKTDLAVSIIAYPSLEYDNKQKIIGQNDSWEVSFLDAEAGRICRKDNLCDDKYDVTWTSSQQPICPTDLYKGALQYIFKKSGVHKITVTVQHKLKPKLRSEATATFIVPLENPYNYIDKNLGCSYP